MSEPRALTPTSYAILGLLAIKPWTTYELATQIERTVRRFWPRTRSKLYEEPKKLVAAGLAEAAKGAQGRRPRTVYTITPAGRHALAALARPARVPSPSFESEHLLKVFYAGSGTTDDVRATLADLRGWVHERTEHNVRVGRELRTGVRAFPERQPILVLTGRFLDDYLEMIDRWAAWASEIVATWPDTPHGAAPNFDEMAATLRQAMARAERWRADQPRECGRPRPPGTPPRRSAAQVGDGLRRPAGQPLHLIGTVDCTPWPSSANTSAAAPRRTPEVRRRPWRRAACRRDVDVADRAGPSRRTDRQPPGRSDGLGPGQHIGRPSGRRSVSATAADRSHIRGVDHGRSARRRPGRQHAAGPDVLGRASRFAMEKPGRSIDRGNARRPPGAARSGRASASTPRRARARRRGRTA